MKKDKILRDIYVLADELAKNNKQVVGDKNEYYITLSQLNEIVMKFYLE